MASPDIPDPTRSRTRTMVFTAVAGLLVAGLLFAFVARAAGAGRQCTLRWEAGPAHFVDPCDGRIYPADGTGLVSFPAHVDDKGRLVIDLSQPIQPTVPTTAAATGY